MSSGSKIVLCILLTGGALVLGGCGDDGPPAGPADGGDGGSGTDARVDTGTEPSLTGTVKDRAGVVVAGAKVQVGATSVFSDSQGRYTLAAVTPGTAHIDVTRNWFKPTALDATVAPSGVTTQDLTIDEMPLKLETADQTLATGYATSFDWTKATVSIAIAAKPTRRDFDNAVFFHNPALYRDTSAEPMLTPTPPPQIAGGMAANFSFQIKTGAAMGQEVLELASIADAPAGTALGATEPTSFMMWTPLVNWVAEWDAAKAAELRSVGTAVRQQNWGGNSQRPQEIEKAYLDATGALWVKVVFAPFVQLGPGIADDDGDGLKEIYAKVASRFVAADIAGKLTSDYIATIYNTHGLSKEVTKSLNELYSTTAAQVEKYIGEPFEISGTGTISYPFVVLRHANGKKNVILVAPGP
jgi:Carboxypeptidase regulatory-like domain